MKVKMPKMGSTQKQEEESSHPARAIKQTSPTKGKSPFQDGLLPGCAPLINKVATSPPRHVARSYNRSRCCPTSIRPRELVLSTSTPSVAPSLPPQPEYHFHKLATSSACSHGAAIIATGQLCDGVGRILPFPLIQDDWLPRMNASKDLFLIRLEDLDPYAPALLTHDLSLHTDWRLKAAVEANPLRPMI